MRGTADSGPHFEMQTNGWGRSGEEPEAEEGRSAWSWKNRVIPGYKAINP